MDGRWLGQLNGWVSGWDNEGMVGYMCIQGVNG